MTMPEIMAPEYGSATARGLDAVHQELARLTSAHQQLLRYARDLKHAYEAERERRSQLTQATLDLVAILTATNQPLSS
jgi:hypothetical protein